MSVTVTITGLRDLDAQLTRLSKAAGKGALRRSLKAAAEPTAAIARSLAPDDPETGGFDLRNSIKVGTKLSRSQAKAHRRMFRDQRASVEMFVGAGPLPQAVYNEFGTAPFINKGKFAGTRNPGVRAQPFMRPAWDQDQRAMLERLKTELWKQVSAAIVRAERRAARGR